MSRRARLEEEKLKLASEEREEENKLKLQKERIYAPLVWRRLNSGIKIQDLKPNYYEPVQDIIQECYLEEEVLCRNAEVKKDPESTSSMLRRVLYTLKDKTSIIALDEPNEDEIAGFLLMRVMHQETFDKVFNRAQAITGEAHKKCTDFVGYLNRKSDVFKAFDCDKYLQYDLLCITPNYRKKGLGLKMMLSGLDLARTLNISVVMGVFSSFKLQKLAKITGMRVVYEINYTQWRDKNKEMIFDEPGVGNYTCAIMAGVVPPPPPPEIIIEEKEILKTVKEKRESKKKKEKKKG